MYGGTFDPIHNTHLAIARAALEQGSLDSVLFVVSANPPHKRDATYATAEDRYALVEAALLDEEKLTPSRLELDRRGPSYMADTLDAVHAENPNAKLFLIIGLDSLVDIPKWKAPDRILARAHLLAVPRPGGCDIPSSLDGHYTLLKFSETDLSSTEVRARIAAGEPCDDVLPAAVVDTIRARGLYRECIDNSARK